MTIQQLSTSIGHSVDVLQIAINMTVQKMNPMKIQEATGLKQNQYSRLIGWYGAVGHKVGKPKKTVFVEKSEKPPEIVDELQPFGFSYESLSPAEKKIFNSIKNDKSSNPKMFRSKM